jgi:hypothetical protein
MVAFILFYLPSHNGSSAPELESRKSRSSSGSMLSVRLLYRTYGDCISSSLVSCPLNGSVLLLSPTITLLCSRCVYCDLACILWHIASLQAPIAYCLCQPTRTPSDDCRALRYILPGLGVELRFSLPGLTHFIPLHYR